MNAVDKAPPADKAFAYGFKRPPTMQPRLLIAAALLAGALGSLHAFSVLLAPFEQLFGATRAAVSLIYSAAIVCVTVAVLVAHRLQAAYHPAIIALGAGIVAAAGLLLTASTTRLAGALVGFGLLFGAANGTGYSLALTQGAAGWPARKGFATGVVTAAYAAGAMASSRLMQAVVEREGPSVTLTALGGAVLGCATAAALLLARGAQRSPPPLVAEGSAGATRTLALLWLGYLCGATAGLMSIGHAAGIVSAKGGTAAVVAAGAVVIAFGNGLGSLLSGWLTDRLPIARVLGFVSLVAGVAGLLAAVSSGPSFAVAILGIIGFAYGALIAVYPVAAHRYFGATEAARSFGLIFTAWGIAGLAGPWLGGLLFDRTGDYDIALAVAAAIAAAGMIPAILLPRVGAVQRFVV